MGGWGSGHPTRGWGSAGPEGPWAGEGQVSGRAVGPNPAGVRGGLVAGILVVVDPAALPRDEGPACAGLGPEAGMAEGWGSRVAEGWVSCMAEGWVSRMCGSGA
jgi:hypothetical protein